jgi:hypothetical protein
MHRWRPSSRLCEPEMVATVRAGGRLYTFDGRWIEGSPWQRFGLYNSYVVIRSDGALLKMPAHAGELVPGSTEDLLAALRALDSTHSHPPAPMTLELDPTFRCASRDCGGSCFSVVYRSRAPNASIPTPLLKAIIHQFHEEGGRILRFDGGGDPLLHRDVRSGELIEFAAERGLKTTVLTSGDALDHADLERFGRSGCYVRLSLNAATDRTRQLFHGNKVLLHRILTSVERLVGCLARFGSQTPVGATFLLSPINYQEVLTCAHLARDAGVRHFSVRRILGPNTLRPRFIHSQKERLSELLAEVQRLHSENFRVAVPWRPVDEPDLNPAAGDFTASRCWQSTFKTVLEPDPVGTGARAQLCGRYRGSGLGQRFALPTLFSLSSGTEWVAHWRRSFTDYPIAREDLFGMCVSCIDRGFITMVDRLMRFVGDPRTGFRVLHLDSPQPHEVLEWEPIA